MNDNPFDTVESALEFLALFESAIGHTLADVRNDLSAADVTERRSDALRLAVYKLEKLEYHIGRSKRMANDLRLLRRLFFEERAAMQSAGAVFAALVDG